MHSDPAMLADAEALPPVILSPQRKHKVERAHRRIHLRQTHIVKPKQVRRETRASTHSRQKLTVAICSRPGWYVQVGAFAEAWRFDHLRLRMRHDGFETCKAPQQPKDLSLLLVGGYPTREAAHHIQLRIQKLLGSDSYLRHLPLR
jgi:cell division septation protein DedD